MKTYETIVTRPYADRLREIKHEVDTINALNREGHIQWLDDTIGAIRPAAESIVPFTVPFTHEGKVYIDSRPFYGRGAESPNRNLADYMGLKIRAGLTHMWEIEPATLEQYITPTSVVFGHWIADGIASRYDSDIVDRSVIQVLATAYYVINFYRQLEGDNVKSEELRNMIVRALGARGAGLPTSTIDPILDGEFMKAAIEAGEMPLAALAAGIRNNVSFQMGEFTENTLMRLCAGGTWIGWESNTIALMALEYPPCMIYMVGMCAKNSMYRNKTRIGRVVNANRRSVNPDAMARLVTSLEV